eukprot:307376-Heterocapsa_arctica.AAC.1
MWESQKGPPKRVRVYSYPGMEPEIERPPPNAYQVMIGDGESCPDARSSSGAPEVRGPLAPGRVSGHVPAEKMITDATYTGDMKDVSWGAAPSNKRLQGTGQRSREKDCRYVLQSGKCVFGSNCMFSHRRASQASHSHQGSDRNTAATGDGNPHGDAPLPVQGNPDAPSVSEEYIRITKRQEARRILLERKARAEAQAPGD